MPHPGFDTSFYPGDHAMQVWKAHSPFEWVGYYFDSPCHSNNSWRGKRAFIESLGFHILPIYVGLQGGNGCKHTQLSAAAGTLHGGQAAAKMTNDGFPQLRYLYLDIEPVDTISALHKDYASAWVEAVLDDGKYLPALYLHRRNADVFRDILKAGLVQHGHHDPARLWVCGGPLDFDLNDVPSKSTIPDAFAWQGDLDHNRTFGNITLKIDRSVSLTSTPGA